MYMMITRESIHNNNAVYIAKLKAPSRHFLGNIGVMFITNLRINIVEIRKRFMTLMLHPSRQTRSIYAHTFK